MNAICDTTAKSETLSVKGCKVKTITRLAQNDTGNVADRHMKQILSIYNGAGRAHNLPGKR